MGFSFDLDESYSDFFFFCFLFVFLFLFFFFETVGAAINIADVLEQFCSAYIAIDKCPGISKSKIPQKELSAPRPPLRPPSCKTIPSFLIDADF